MPGAAGELADGEPGNAMRCMDSTGDGPSAMDDAGEWQRLLTRKSFCMKNHIKKIKIRRF